MAKDFLGKGWKFPVSIDAAGNIAMSEFEDDIRESIRIILLTSKGERMMRPAFGAGLHDFVFQTMSAKNIGRMQKDIQTALNQWEPRIKVLALEVAEDPGELGKLLINIDYQVRATNTRFNFVFPFYLKEIE